ncbi:hypothetical protein RclHR1_17070001 [Rhizophagus clarus]|uniref:Uncharacterized protein n=1 Tax=Rhizophagus clarus TaxID=94130 RepID=A0A2Z6QN83_9GLOM|nr:hypothetical protein RclHR1_17070001 [Rhizophagus clarus]GES74831.1 hypothetical protein GLOIN_2v1479490 [Rhizophagus clarus]
MAPFTCPYIKRDGTICGNKCWLPEGCYRHWKLYEKNSKKSSCLICGFPTDADLGYCSKNCSKYSAKFHSHNYQMRQKRKAEACQLRIPEAPIFELSDVVRPLQPRIYEALVSESDDEDMGINLFGD